MRKITKLGIFTIILGLIACFIHAGLLILNFLIVTDLQYYIPFTRILCIIIIPCGILLISIGGLISKNPNQDFKEDTINKKAFIFIFFLIVTPIIAFAVLFPSFSVPTVILLTVDILSVSFILWILLALPHITAKLGDEIIEIDFLGYHFHESIFGIGFIIPGFFFVIHGTILIDTLFGCYIMLAGSFLIGRDIEDVKKFKIVEKINKTE
ncbi:MAG: hypothetical protein ACTSRG_00145 [Candidatus Helarchaeota archaeon]